MQRIVNTKPADATPGFAIKLAEDTALGLAILVAEFGGGNYQPVGVVVSITRGIQLAGSGASSPLSAASHGQLTHCRDPHVDGNGAMPAGLQCNAPGSDRRLSKARPGFASVPLEELVKP